MGRGEGLGGSQNRPDVVQEELVQESIVVERYPWYKYVYITFVQVCIHICVKGTWVD